LVDINEKKQWRGDTQVDAGAPPLLLTGRKLSANNQTKAKCCGLVYSTVFFFF